MIGLTIIVPMYASCLGWFFIVALTMIEVGVNRLVLRRLGIRVRGLLPRIAVVHLTTWIGVMAFEAWLIHNSKSLSGRGAFVVCLMVVVLEYAMLRTIVVRADGGGRLRLASVHAGTLTIAGNGFIVGFLTLPVWLFG